MQTTLITKKESTPLEKKRTLKGEDFPIGCFLVASRTNIISPSKEIDEFSDLFGVRNVPDSIFGDNSITISGKFFSLMFSGKDSVRTMKTNPQNSIGIVNQFINQSRPFVGKLEISEKDTVKNNFQSTEAILPVKVSTHHIPFNPNEVLFVPPINVKVASSSLWKGKTNEVSEKLGFQVGEEMIEQDWTYLNAYEGLITWKGLASGKFVDLINF